MCSNQLTVVEIADFQILPELFDVEVYITF